jgi:N-acyl-L-homoserine lactone synthetase
MSTSSTRHRVAAATTTAANAEAREAHITVAEAMGQQTVETARAVATTAEATTATAMALREEDINNWGGAQLWSLHRRRLI